MGLFLWLDTVNDTDTFRAQTKLMPKLRQLYSLYGRSVPLVGGKSVTMYYYRTFPLRTTGVASPNEW